MFNVGGGELMLIALVALLVLGPDKLPDFARKTARIIGQVRQMSQGFQNEMKSVINFDDTPDVAQSSPGPRLVGPIDTGSGPIESEPAADSTDTPSSPAASSDSPPSASTDHDSSTSTDHGDDTSASGTSAA